MRAVILIIILFTTQLVYSQSSSVPEKTNGTKFNSSQRQALSPFKIAKQLKLVSFSQSNDEGEKRKAAEWGLPILNDTIYFSRLDQIIELTPAQTDSLTDIL